MLKIKRRMRILRRIFVFLKGLGITAITGASVPSIFALGANVLTEEGRI